MIINIANEPFGNNTTANYVADTIAAIQALRSAGLTHTLMIDAANWGQDWSNTMRTNAMALWNADTLHNLVVQRAHVRGVPAGQRRSPPTCRPSTTWACRWSSASSARSTTASSSTPIRHRAGAGARQRLHRLVLVGQWRRRHRARHDEQLRSRVAHDLGQPHRERHERHSRDLGARHRVRHADNNLTVSPTTLSFASAASSSPVTVTANVSWTVTDNQTWITASPTSGTNNGSFTVSATANTGTAAAPAR